jgi:hypothetical protein
MDKAAMVSVDIQRGSELLGALERANVRVGVALWMLSSEYEDWRLVVASRQFDSPDLRDAFRLIHDSLAPSGFTAARTPPMIILPMSDPFIKELRRRFGKSKSVEGMRLGGQMIGDRFVQDAYVYRIS